MVGLPAYFFLSPSHHIPTVIGIEQWLGMTRNILKITAAGTAPEFTGKTCVYQYHRIPFYAYAPKFKGANVLIISFYNRIIKEKICIRRFHLFIE